MHQIKPFVDIVQAHRVGDHWINLNLAIHIPIDNLRHICAATRAAKLATLRAKKNVERAQKLEDAFKEEQAKVRLD